MILTATPLDSRMPSCVRSVGEARGDGDPEQVGVGRAVPFDLGPAVQSGVLELHGVESLQDVEQPEEDRDLQEHGQTAHQRIDLLRLIELHHLLAESLLIALVLGLQLLELGLQRLHRPLRPDLLDEDREQDDPDGDHQEDDREDPRPVRPQPLAGAGEDCCPQLMPAQEDPGDGRVDRTHQPTHGVTAPVSSWRRSFVRGAWGCAGAARSRSHRGGTDGTATTARSRDPVRGPVRASRSRSTRTRCTTGRTGNGPEVRGLSNDGTRRSAPTAHARPPSWAR